jgi:AcrR family transcriptional regulator
MKDAPVIESLEQLTNQSAVKQEHRFDSAVRTKILRQASELFFQFGPSKVTMEEIAERLGMSKKTLYKVFASKDDLLEAVVEDFQLTLQAMMQPVLEAAGNADESEFTTLIAGMSESLASVMGRTASSPMFKDMQRNYPEVWMHLEERRRTQITATFQRVLHEGLSRGIFRPELNYELFIQLYIIAIEYVMSPITLSKLPLTADEAYRMLIRVFFFGALTDKGRTYAQIVHTQHTDGYDDMPAYQGQASYKEAQNGLDNLQQQSHQSTSKGAAIMPDCMVDFLNHGLVEVV